MFDKPNPLSAAAPSRPRRSLLSCLVVAIWVINLVALALLGIALLTGRFGSLPRLPLSAGLAQAIGGSATPTPTQLPSATPVPTTAVPSPTPTPASTPIVDVQVAPSHAEIVTLEAALTPTVVPTPVPLVIGQSVEGRLLQVYLFGSGPVKRLMVFGIHGGSEWNTIALADELIPYLSEHPELIPADNTLAILPFLNPDGEARGQSAAGRGNAHGVDLNRNWNAYWQATWPGRGCDNAVSLTAGDHPFSEPETLALERYIVKEHFDALISYHSAALGIFPGGNPPYQRSVTLAKAIAAVSAYPYPPVQTGCLITGDLADWAALDGIGAVDLELTDHVNTDFDVNLRVLAALLAWRR